MDTVTSLNELRRAVQQELTQNILPFYIEHGRDWQHGGFHGHIANDNQVEPDASKGSVQCARILWSFAQAYRVLGDEIYKHMAVNAFDYLRRYLWDHQHDGLRWSATARNAPLDDNKLIYAQAFGIYGLSEFYMATGNKTALDLMMRLFHRLERHGRDRQHGGYWESCAADWTLSNSTSVDTADYPVAKSMNTNLHVLEAYTNLYRANPHHDVHQALCDLIQVMCERVINRETGHMWLHFDADWRPVNGHVSYGHDIEASWLLVEAAEIVNDSILLHQCQTIALYMAEVVRDQAISADGSLQNEPSDEHREWWPQAEALVGFVNAYQLSADPRYLEAAVNCWHYINTHMIDHEDGEWFWAVTAAGTPLERVKSGMWKTPYHNGRACFELIQRLKVLIMPHYGFNFQWIFIWEAGRQPEPADERALDCMVEWGFDFVRIPASYWFWTKNFDYFRPDEKVLKAFDSYLTACQSRDLHMSLNAHRAPGYCINGNHLEKHNLWLDKEAQDGFVFQWEMFARRYKGVPNSQLSFDLVNEPPAVGQYGMSRDHHAAVIRRTVAAIRAIDPEREIVIDGLDGGHMAMPELADLGVIHSGRGYQPQNVTHYLAEWWPEWEGQPEPVYPQTQFHDQTWNREALYAFYRPWREVQAQGVQVHIGEFGCYNQTPNDVALRWFADVLSVFQQCGWGYALWEFAGPFGIVEHGRAGTRYETVNGYAVDWELLELLRTHRLPE